MKKGPVLRDEPYNEAYIIMSRSGSIAFRQRPVVCRKDEALPASHAANLTKYNYEQRWEYSLQTAPRGIRDKKCSGVQTHVSPCVLLSSVARPDSRSSVSSWPSYATPGEGGGGGDGVRSGRDGRGVRDGGDCS